MPDIMIRFVIPGVFVVLLAGCSDRISNLEPVGPMDSEIELTYEQVQDIHEAAEASATAQPEFSSVIQTMPSNVDDISTSFDAETRDVVVTISRDDGTELVLDTSQPDVDKRELGEHSLIDPRRGTDARLLGHPPDGLGTFKARVITSWDPDDLADWGTGGYWAHLTDDGTQVGAFVDGPEFDAAPSLPATGSASYLGLVGGLFTADLGSDYTEGSYASGEYDGHVQLTIAFDGGPNDDASVLGRISDLDLVGDLVDHEGGTTSYRDGHKWRRVEMRLDNTPLSAEGELTGTLSAYGGHVTSSEGVWGAVVSSRQDANGDPRAIAGTQGAIVYTTDGSEFTFMGALFAYSEAWLFSDAAEPIPVPQSQVPSP